MNYLGTFGRLTAGSSHTYVITVTDKLGKSTKSSGSFTVPIPAIGGVTVSLANASISWNESDPTGIAGAQLTIDGHALSKSAIQGPTAAASGVNYVGVFGSLKAGVHTYVITATDAAGYSKTLTGQITVTPPKISGATVSLATDSLSWNVTDPGVLSGAQLAIDGHALSQSAIKGPTAAASGVNYAATLGVLKAGVHTYVITATDKLGNAATLTGKITVSPPKISGVTVSLATDSLGWNVTDASSAVTGASTGHRRPHLEQ